MRSAAVILTATPAALLAALLAAILAATAGLTACTPANRPDSVNSAAAAAGDDGFHGTVLDPPIHPADAVLKTTDGATVNLARPAGDKVTAVFFGFTHCTDVCPTTMADLAAARRSLPKPLADRVNVMFVTVDPDRDTSAVLTRWLDRFDRDFIGLRGPTAVVHQIERSLFAAESQAGPAQKDGGDPHNGHEPSNDDAGYEVSHTGTVYVFGPHDRSLIYTGGTTAQQYSEDFTQLLPP